MGDLCGALGGFEKRMSKGSDVQLRHVCVILLSCC